MISENCFQPIEFALIANKTDLLNERIVTEIEAHQILQQDSNLILKNDDIL
jgi:hypothetical protein